jgi:shikimate kinase
VPAPTDPRGGHVVLVGLMGAGKTTVGRALAERLGLPFSDSDRVIEAEQGRTVRELADELGTDGMHALEKAHLLGALAQPGPSVIAAAASTIDDPECRAALVAPGVRVVWLRASADELAGRFDRRRHRPRFGRDPRGLLAEQAAEREPLFASLDPVEVVTEGRPTASVVDELVTRCY